MTAALVVAVTFAIYAGSLHAGFVGDDFMILHRLRALAAPGDVLRFFRGEFFEYYRPLAFVSHAVDWAIAGQQARQFHLTNVLLHATNAVLVLLIGRELSPRSIAGLVAALLFALHASNHEAVVWMSARFDLLATCFALAAILVMVRGGGGARVAAPVLFLGALLSKESAVALPPWRGICGVPAPCQHKDGAAAVPWLLALALYSVVRHLAGGVSAIGGAARLPKLVAFLILLAGLLLLAGDRRVRVRDWLRPRRGPVIGALALGLTSAAIAAAAGGRLGQVVAEKLAVAGFAIVHLVSPFIDLFDAPFYLDSERVILARRSHRAVGGRRGGRAAVAAIAGRRPHVVPGGIPRRDAAAHLGVDRRRATCTCCRRLRRSSSASSSPGGGTPPARWPAASSRS
jgi:hypothetical protein